MTETNAERLSRISKLKIWTSADNNKFATIDESDLCWVLGQVKRVQTLLDKLDEEYEYSKQKTEYITHLNQLAIKYRETLAFYAYQNNYKRDGEGESTIDIDDGHQAFIALGVLK